MNQQSENERIRGMNAINPSPVPGAPSITAVVRKSGKITGYQLSDGRVLSKKEGVALAKQNGIRGVGIATNQGSEYLRSQPDDMQANNLTNLPSI